jgi:hypothetical protein
MCSGFINKDEFHFTTTDFNPTFPYPIKKSVCWNCCKNITSDDFMAKLKNLQALCLNIKTKIASLEQVKKEQPF